MCTKCHFSREEQFCCLQFRWYFILTDFTAVVLKIWEILQRIRELLENWWNVSQSTFLHEIVTAARDDFAVRIIIIFIVFDTSKLTTRAEHSSRWAKIRAKCAFKTVIFPSLPRSLTLLFFDTEDVPGNDRTSLISWLLCSGFMTILLNSEATPTISPSFEESHVVWKSQKRSHSTFRAKRSTFTFWVDQSS